MIKLSVIVIFRSSSEKAVEWRILGQEQDGSLMTSWVSYSQDISPKSNIGIYNPVGKVFDILYTFKEKVNVIQASVNGARTLLGFVIKKEVCLSIESM